VGCHTHINLHEALPYTVFSDHNKLSKVFVEIKWGQTRERIHKIAETWKISFYNRSPSVLSPTGNP
jgi:hypothetical protein